MIFTKEQQASFTEASKPLIKWLNENAPHSQVEVTVTKMRAEYKEVSYRVLIFDFVKD